ncbi:MAG: hypothetical protein PHI90_00335 [Clostridia bacterium]|nr:hypothetical protein [Clostridia bacterium]MDD4047276.1 hypothetical protein [Clostridia bacterium]
MAFTISASNTSNTAGTADVALTLSPSDALFSPATLVPGESLGSPALDISNSGDVTGFYSIFADWKAVSPTTARQARILADRLNINIEASPSTELYSGVLSGLNDKPAAGRMLTTTHEDLLTFVVNLPDTVGTITEDLDLSVDLVFVSEASPAS